VTSRRERQRLASRREVRAGPVILPVDVDLSARGLNVEAQAASRPGRDHRGAALRRRVVVVVVLVVAVVLRVLAVRILLLLLVLTLRVLVLLRVRVRVR